MVNKNLVAEKLLQLKAVKLNPQEPFTWASGWKSPIYCDNRKLLSFPFDREFIKSEMCSVLFEKFPSADILAGVATAGIAWGAMAADQLKLPFIYVRGKAKMHGLGNQIEGYYEQRQKVVVVEDLISTGKSSMEACEALRTAGLEVVGLVSIFSYGIDKAKKVFDDAKLEVHSLTNYRILIELAKEKNLISNEELNSLLEWQQDPESWSNKVTFVQ